MKLNISYKNKIELGFFDKSNTKLALHFENARRVLCRIPLFLKAHSDDTICNTANKKLTKLRSCDPISTLQWCRRDAPSEGYFETSVTNGVGATRLMLTSLLTLIIFTFFSENAFAQIPPDNLSDTELRTWLKQNWYDGEHNELGYSEARRKMYGFIDNHNDTITCVYSGFVRLNNYGNQITFPNPINTEHTIPQSLFNSAEPMRSDIHAIFPTYITWNSERGNSPLLDIPDSATEIWMRDNDAQGGIPTTNIDEYSESITNGSFEPREDHKGNAARAIFYFYTMYPQVGQITQVGNISTLCAWHAADPPDAAEITRNDGTEQYQGNRNPYIDLPYLAEKAWGCMVTSTVEPEENSADILVAPNPFNGRFELSFSSVSNEKITLHLYDINGRQIQEMTETMPSNGTLKLEIDRPLADGVFILTLRQGNNIYHKKLINNRH